MVTNLVPAAASLGSHPSLSQVPSSPAKGAADLGPYQSPSQRPHNQHTWWPASDHIRAQPNQLHKGHNQRVDSPEDTIAPLSKSSFMKSAPCTTTHPQQSWPFLTASQPESQSYPLTCQQQSRFNYNRRAQTIHTRDTPRAPSSSDQGD